jgi:ABC-2 type transport system permease protein
MHLLRIYAELFSMSLRRQLAFRTDLVFEVAATSATLASSMTAVLVLFTQTSTLGGFTPAQALALLGSFHLISGIRRALVEPNLRFISGQVSDGSFDGLLIQPAPVILLASLGGSAPLALTQSVLGAGVVGLSLVGSGSAPTPVAIGCWVIMIISASVVMWATRCISAAVMFWTLGLQLDVVYDAMWQIGPYPTTIFSRPIKIIFTYLIPVAFLATMPAAVLTGLVAPAWALTGIAAAVTTAVAAILVWRVGLGRYASATS